MPTPPQHDQVHYLLQLAATDPGRDYKRRLLAELDLRRGHTVLDLGCGPGADLATMADRVGEQGTVIGVDHDPAMVEAAQHRVEQSNIEIRLASGSALPLDDHSVDRARIDRVLMHVESPAAILAEVGRVLRPGGLVGLVEPDWDTLAFDAPDLTTTRAYTRYVADRVIRNGTIGRQLTRLAMEAGFAVQSIIPTPIVFGSFAAADQILRMGSVAARAVDDGAIAAHAAEAWLTGLATGPFQAGFTFYTVIAETPNA
jgi:ubiquinone/menaquinone biosynthesis C-methylase UbiE